jgi:Mg2+ and Co2+ transporter CorA
MDKAIPDAEKFSKLAAAFNKLFGGVAGTLKSGAGIVEGVAKFKETMQKFGSELDGVGAYLSDTLIPMLMEVGHAFWMSLEVIGGEDDEAITNSYKEWANRLQSIASIIGSAGGVAGALVKTKAAMATLVDGLQDIGAFLSNELIPLVMTVQHAFWQNLEAIGGEEDEGLTASFKMWGERMKAITVILDAVNKAVEMLTKKSEAFKTGAAKGLEVIRDAITKNVIPVVRGIHAAFKRLPLLNEDELISKSLKIWAARYQGIASILGAVNTAVEMLSTKSDKFKSGAAKGLIAIRDAITKNVIPVIQGIHAAFKKLPLLDPDELISKSLKIWAERYGAISSILGGVNTAVEMLINKSDRFKSAAAKGLETIRDAIVKNVIPVVRGVHAAFKELPILDEDEVIAASLKIWAERYGAIAGILDSINSVVDMLVGKSDSFKTAAAKGLIAIRDAITKHVVPVIRGIHAALKELPVLDPEEEISASLKIWSDRLSAGLGIITSTMGIANAALDDYVSPDLSKIRKISNDAVKVVGLVGRVVGRFWTTAEAMAPLVEKIEGVQGMVSTVLTTITDTIAVAKGLAEMSWREVKKHQVDSFTNNLANIVKWLTDPESGIAAIQGLSNMASYALAASQLGEIVTEIVEAVRIVMTLPAIWDDRLNLVSKGLATFLQTITGAVTSAMANVGRSIIAALQGVLNDGVFFQMGLRNANAYEMGWKFGMDIHSDSGIAEGIAKNIVGGFEKGGLDKVGESRAFNLYVTTTQPAVDVVTSFRMLEAMA